MQPYHLYHIFFIIHNIKSSDIALPGPLSDDMKIFLYIREKFATPT